MIEGSNPHRPDFRSSQQHPPTEPAHRPMPAQQRYPAPDQPVTRPPHRPRRSRPMVAVLATVVLIALAVGGGAGYLGSRLAQSGTNASSGQLGSSGLGPTTPAPAGSGTPTSTASVPASKGAADTVAVAEQLLPSTVTIRVNTGNGTSLGSGFVIDDEGRIMTNNHVVDADGAIWVTNSAGHREKASVLGRSASYDLAVIQVDKPAGFRPARLGDSATIRVGEAAVAIGSPLGLGGSVTEGIISAVNRPVSVGEANSGDGPAYLNALQTDAPINHGNSGGPLVDAGGAVIGVNSAILTGSGATSSSEDSGNIGIGFAIPINQARQIGQLLITDGYATYPVLNATVSGDGSGAGVLLSSVTPGGAADRAGLQPEDIVTSIDGQPVAATEDLIVAVRNHRPGDAVTLRYERDGIAHTAKLTLASKRG